MTRAVYVYYRILIMLSNCTVMREIWRNIKGYEDYSISSLGRIKRIRGSSWRSWPGRVLKGSSHNNGYTQISLCKNGSINRFYVHRIVGYYFLKNPNKLKEINHKNGIKSDNRACNLEWVTHRDNIVHARMHLKKRMGSINRPFICHQNKKRYLSYSEASNDLGIGVPTLKSYFRLKIKNPRHGFSFSRV